MALAIVAAYLALFTGLHALLGVDYDELFDNASNAYKGAVLPLGVGSVLLAVFVVWARWDWIWRDPKRLPMSRFLWVPPAIMVLGLLLRFAGIEWGDVPFDLVIAVLLAGALVGFAEEVLFRGIVLRALRTEGRSEALAAIYTTALFGLFHLPNAIFGAELLPTLGQVGIAALTGFALYLIRRGTGWLVYAMIAHGVWDISTFLALSYSDEKNGFILASLSLIFINAAILLFAIVAVWRRDRSTFWQTSGCELAPAGPR